MHRLVLIAVLALASESAGATCPPGGHTRDSLQALKQREFAMADKASREVLALALVDCLAAPDPALRDGIGYEALAHWMRAGAFDATFLRELRTRVQATVDGGEGEGFARPFAALVLAEVARTDRVAPWMGADERTAMVEQAARYVETVQDYRGFDDAQGWRHGVAHGADWLMQLALNPALDRTQATRILHAVAVQAVPESAHAYVFGEPERLARPVLAIARRGLIEQIEWTHWFASLPPRIGEPEQAYADSAWLARRHDLVAFFNAIHVEADRPGDEATRGLKRALLPAMHALP